MSNRRPLTDFERRRVKFILDFFEKEYDGDPELTQRDTDFLENTRQWFKRDGKLSDPQLAWLEDIWGKLNE